MFIDEGVYNHTKLRDCVKVITRNLNKVIDVNFYPVPEARKSNMRHRPIGMGVQVSALLLVVLSHASAMPLSSTSLCICYAMSGTDVRLGRPGAGGCLHEAEAAV
eukprot:2564548-Rhodomonas_salina.4